MNSGDLTGSTWSTGASESFDYDIFGNLKSMTNSAAQASEYLMDSQNRRVAKSLNGTVKQRFLYQNSLQVAAELTSSGLMKSEFVYSSGRHVPDYMIKDGVRYQIISNHLGSPRLVVNANTGAVVQRIEYDVWGKVLLDSNTCFQPFGFAGGLRDPNHSLVRFGARDYDPEVGRWTSKDPILFKGGDTNLFGYVQNDPINWIDPEGKFAVVVPIVSGIIEGAAIIGSAIGICEMAKKAPKRENCQTTFDNVWNSCIASGRKPGECVRQASDAYTACLKRNL